MPCHFRRLTWARLSFLTNVILSLLINGKIMVGIQKGPYLVWKKKKLCQKATHEWRKIKDLLNSFSAIFLFQVFTKLGIGMIKWPSNLWTSPDGPRNHVTIMNLCIVHDKNCWQWAHRMKFQQKLTKNILIHTFSFLVTPYQVVHRPLPANRQQQT